MRIARPALLTVLPALLAGTLSAQTAAPKPAPHAWVGTWAASPHSDSRREPPTLIDSTLREIVHTSIAGKTLRVRFTNEFGTEPLRIDAASIATASNPPAPHPIVRPVAPGALAPSTIADPSVTAIDTASLHNLTFNGQPSVVIPAGAQILSDPVDFATPAFANLAISLYLPVQEISDVTVHGDAAQDNFLVRGNHVSEPTLTGADTITSWYFIKGIDVQPAESRAAAVVAYGDSITDGAWATQNANHRWPDYLAQRLHDNPATANLSVLDEGIGGNCVLITCTGVNALARFDRDVLSQAGVRYVIVLESINDIGTMHRRNRPDYHLNAEDLETGLAQLVARAHEHGIKVFGATLTPYQGAGYYTEEGEQIREAVNRWILSSGVFDGAIDFDKATRDPDHPLTFAPAYDSGDHLHPHDPGYAAMANSIDLTLFR
ncbi:MAG TPA: SGNH/GDSL hydrolase family protein [Acidobacteriaceae bacterium]|nr:SGNH/GDSL hydrolase family protein [Acidobacteriaceae bacterium]